MIQIVSIIFIGVKSMFDNVQINIPGGLDFEVPKMVKVKQNFENHKIDDVALAVKNEINKL